MAPGRPLRIATRGSALARWQAGEVARRLALADPALTVTVVVVETTGDRRRDAPIASLGGQGVFVKEVQGAVLDGRADLAVHSAKDLPSATFAGLDLVAFLPRGDPRDALVGATLAGLGEGATVATGSVRRRVQLAALRPDLRLVDLRGNIGTRLDRVPPGGAIVMAAAALERLGLLDRAAEILEPDVMLPQVGQGVIAVECRAGDAVARAATATVDDPATRAAVLAERAYLAGVGGGCDLPVGAFGQVGDDGVLRVEAMTADPEGVLRRSRRAGPPEAAEALGAALAADLGPARDPGSGGGGLVDSRP